MNKIQKHIKLSDYEEGELKRVLLSGKPREILLANILLMSANGFTPKRIAESLSTSKQTVNNAKRRFFNTGLKCLIRKNAGRAPIAPKITGDVEAKIISIACSKAPDGYGRWTLQMIADKSVELQYIEAVSDESVRRLLKKRNLSLT